MRWRRSSRRWRTLCLPRDIRRSRWRLWAARLLQTVEECAELIQAINKWRRAQNRESIKDAVDHLAEEAADVIIMMEQIKIMVGEPKVNWWIEFKLQRLEERLEESGSVPEWKEKIMNRFERVE